MLLKAALKRVKKRPEPTVEDCCAVEGFDGEKGAPVGQGGLAAVGSTFPNRLAPGYSHRTDRGSAGSISHQNLWSDVEFSCCASVVRLIRRYRDRFCGLRSF